MTSVIRYKCGKITGKEEVMICTAIFACPPAQIWGRVPAGLLCCSVFLDDSDVLGTLGPGCSLGRGTATSPCKHLTRMNKCESTAGAQARC